MGVSLVDGVACKCGFPQSCLYFEIGNDPLHFIDVSSDSIFELVLLPFEGIKIDYDETFTIFFKNRM